MTPAKKSNIVDLVFILSATGTVIAFASNQYVLAFIGFIITLCIPYLHTYWN